MKDKETRYVKMLLLEKNVKLIVMNKDNDGKDLSELNKKIITLLTKTFGGATVSESFGTWEDREKLYQDPNKVIQCNYHHLDGSMVKNIYEAIQMELKQGKQEAVSLLLNDKLAIIEPTDNFDKVQGFINLFK